MERDQLRHHMHVHVASASASVVSERDHLAALMAELKQSVLVCNASGIVLLYNEQAAEQLKNSIDDTRSRVPLGIGRSVRELFDAGLVADTVQGHIVGSCGNPVVEWDARFIGGYTDAIDSYCNSYFLIRLLWSIPTLTHCHLLPRSPRSVTRP